MNFDTRTILEKVLTDDLPQLSANLLQRLYHYTSLEVIQKIVEYDNVRLSHAEYSNDHRELRDAIDIIRNTLATPMAPAAVVTFRGQVEAALNADPPHIDAYIFCMCAGLDTLAHPEDMLSQWRAYARDGRGGVVTLTYRELSHIVWHVPGLRINPVIYDPPAKQKFVDAILAEGYRRYLHIGIPAVDETKEALLFCAPLMKHEGFAEEREWRLIYAPRHNAAPANLINFHPRRDCLAPYIDLNALFAATPPIPLGAPNSPPVNVPRPTGTPLIPITAIMIGPSGSKDLNVRAMHKVVAKKPAPSVAISASGIPYRSLE